ncbi:krev interaction trapped protein 1-like [Watersipora subatra]|uniref:krev interaction trapped protein 1-like n=1 Tax=Watersipora subatra TaxID=2589382 RepID=UPI00355BC16E
MEGVDVHLAVIRPKPFHRPPKNEFQANFYDILLLEIAHNESRLLKGLPQVSVPYQEDPRVKVVDFLYYLTGADRGGLRALRSVYVPPNDDEPISNKKEVSRAALYCLIVDSADKLNQHVVDQIATLPGFYDLNHMFESVKAGQNVFTRPANIMLIRLQCWLVESQNRPDFIQGLLRKSPQDRLVMAVDNPCYIARNKPLIKMFRNIRGSFQETLSERCTANEAFTKMMSIEKCDKVVINPLFGSGLQYKHRVDAYSVNSYWGCGKPDITKIRLAAACMVSRPSVLADDYPLHKLAYEGDARQITAHLKLGYSANKRDPYSWLPIHYAAWFGRVEACKALITTGRCSPNAVTDVDCWTPLHHAALNGQRYVIEFLLSLDTIDVNALDSKKQVALNLCEHSQQPKFVKCTEILKSAMDKPYPIIHVYLMDKDESYKALNLVSNGNTTVIQLHQQMMKELILPKQYEHFFTIWISSPCLQLQLKREHLPVQQLKDWETQVRTLTDCENPAAEIPRLVWRRDVRLGVNHELHTLKNPNAIRLLYEEAYHNYINAFYPCDEADALRLAAILMVLRLGEFEPTKAKHYLSNDLNLQSIVPFTQLRYKTSWVQKIFNQYKKISSDVQVDGKLVKQERMQYNFLLICWNLTVYGSAFFDATQVGKNNKSTPMIIGVNDLGIHAILRDTKQMQHSFKFDQIDWLQKKDEPALEVKIRSNNRVLIFRTKQASLVCSLMKRLSDINIARAK